MMRNKTGLRRKNTVSKRHLILVINPGSTSTKLALYLDDKEKTSDSIIHTTEDLKRFKTVYSQAEWRLRSVMSFLDKNNTAPSMLDAVAGRGGLLKPIESGVYKVNKAILDDLSSARYGEHASNLGGIMAYTIAGKAGCDAFIVDPVVVDEMLDIAHITGLPEIRRRSIFHALNHKSAAREAAKRIGKTYERCNLIVAHLGGGISVAAHRNGKVIDTNDALNGDGPFSPERSGGLPAADVVKMCFSRRYSEKEILSKVAGKGGLSAHRASNQLSDLRRSAEAGDKEARLLFEALDLRISQEIAKHGATLDGKVDCIVLTGGMSHDSRLISMIRRRVRYLGRIEVIPGERELVSLARGVLTVLKDPSKTKAYKK